MFWKHEFRPVFLNKILKLRYGRRARCLQELDGAASHEISKDTLGLLSVRPKGTFLKEQAELYVSSHELGWFISL
jgi:hypothetical protein